jgi:hypothetical protein
VDLDSIGSAHASAAAQESNILMLKKIQDQARLMGRAEVNLIRASARIQQAQLAQTAGARGGLDALV